MDRKEISEFIDKTCEPSFTGENELYSRGKVLHIIMELMHHQRKNSHLEGVIAPELKPLEWYDKQAKAVGNTFSFLNYEPDRVILFLNGLWKADCIDEADAKREAEAIYRNIVLSLYEL